MLNPSLDDNDFVSYSAADSVDGVAKNSAIDDYFFDSRPQKHIQLHLLRDEVLASGSICRATRIKTLLALAK